MARIPIDVHGNTGLPGFEKSCGPWPQDFSKVRNFTVKLRTFA